MAKKLSAKQKTIRIKDFGELKSALAKRRAISAHERLVRASSKVIGSRATTEQVSKVLFARDRQALTKFVEQRLAFDSRLPIRERLMVNKIQGILHSKEPVSTSTLQYLKRVAQRLHKQGDDYGSSLLRRAISSTAAAKGGRGFRSFLGNRDVAQLGSSLYNNAIKPKMDWLMRNKWGRRSVWIGASVLAYNLVRGAAEQALGVNTNTNAIPEYYDRGYDRIKESLTDFGSPVRLDKAAQKVITPYYSTPRKARVTTVDSVINGNIALNNFNSAIDHSRY